MSPESEAGLGPPGRRLLPVPATAEHLLPALERALGGGDAVLPLPYDATEAAEVLAVARPDLPLEVDAAVVVTTSGTTGDPRGVLLSADALRASAEGTFRLLSGGGAPEDEGQWLLAMDPRFVGGLQVLVRSLLAGTTPIAPPAGAPFRADAFTAATQRLTGRRRYTALVPTQLRRLLDAGPEAVEALQGFDAVLLGGAAAPAGLLTEAASAGVRVVTTYGMSETSGGCVYDGQAMPAVSWDLESDTGRIRLSGPVLASGYRLRPDLTRETFVDGRLRTHDIGTLDGRGRLVVLGRLDDLVISGGQKVSLPAVESAIRDVPAVRTAAVVGVPDREWGTRIEAFVVGEVTPDAVRAAVAARLPRAAVPRRVSRVARLPLLPSGKVDRQALVRAAQHAQAPQREFP